MCLTMFRWIILLCAVAVVYASTFKREPSPVASFPWDIRRRWEEVQLHRRPVPPLTLRGGGDTGGGNVLDSDLSLDHSVIASLDNYPQFGPYGSSSQQGSGDQVQPEDADDAERFRQQVVRLMVQAMDSFGFPQSARSLEIESGVTLHDGPALEALALRGALITGDWPKVDAVLSTASWVDSQMRFMAYRQLYVELVCSEKLQEAAQCLETHLHPAARDLSRAHLDEIEHLKSMLSSSGNTVNFPSSREIVAERIMQLVPSDVLLPSNRLEHLLRQSLKYQQTESLYPYTTHTDLNLAADLEFAPAKLPHLRNEINYHTDEVWVCKFSPSGRWLATAGKDGKIAIWCSEALAVDSTRAHQGCGEGTTCARGWRSGGVAASDGTSADDGPAPACDYEHNALVVGIEAQMAVCSITWSSDESMVVAAGWQDNTARAWHVPSGMSAHALAPLQRMVSAVEWLPGHWLCAGGGGDEVILLWGIEPGAAAGASPAAADPVARLATGGRTVLSLSCSSDGKQLVALLSGQVVRVFDLDRITRVLSQQRSGQLEGHGGTVPDMYISDPNANDAVGDTAAGAAGPGLRNAAFRLLQSEMGVAANGADEVMQEALGADGPVTHGLSFIDKTVMNVRAVRGDGSLVMGPRQQQRSKAIDYLDASPYAHVRVFECSLEVSEPVPSLSYISSVLMPAPVPRDRVLLSCVSTHGEPMIVEWDTNSHQIVQTFRGHRMQRFVSGIAAGGPGEALVCAGGDDGRVILWQRQTGRPVKVLLGHEGAVNALSWCHWDSESTGVPYLLASASDDHTVRIWGPRLPPGTMQKGVEHSDAGLNGLMAKLCH